MTTRANLLAIIRESLTDTTQWPDATINVWIADAIKDYSIYFPYIVEKTYNFTGSARSFTISSFSPAPLKVLRVEYPDGEEPPRYLEALSMTNPKFWDGPYYEPRGEPPTDIYIGEQASNGEAAVVRYQAIHTLPTGDASVLTVPDPHLEALRLFCVWKAAEEIFLSEEIDPDTREFLVSQMGLNVIRCERLYRNKIEAYQASSLSERAGPWKMDGEDRIY